jgi:hypothetical protein
VAPHALRIDGETPVRTPIAKSHGRDPEQTWTIQQIRRTACPSTELKPVQCRAATSFQVRLIPHKDKLLDAALESKPSYRQVGSLGKAKLQTQRER